jgi:hypothetical protein
MKDFGEELMKRRAEFLKELNLAHDGTVRLTETPPEVPEGVKEIFGEPDEVPNQV